MGIGVALFEVRPGRESPCRAVLFSSGYASKKQLRDGAQAAPALVALFCYLRPGQADAKEPRFGTLTCLSSAMFGWQRTFPTRYHESTLDSENTETGKSNGDDTRGVASPFCFLVPSTSRPKNTARARALALHWPCAGPALALKKERRPPDYVRV